MPRRASLENLAEGGGAVFDFLPGIEDDPALQPRIQGLRDALEKSGDGLEVLSSDLSDAAVPLGGLRRCRAKPDCRGDASAAKWLGIQEFEMPDRDDAPRSSRSFLAAPREP